MSDQTIPPRSPTDELSTLLEDASLCDPMQVDTMAEPSSVAEQPLALQQYNGAAESSEYLCISPNNEDGFQAEHNNPGFAGRTDDLCGRGERGGVDFNSGAFAASSEFTDDDDDDDEEEVDDDEEEVEHNNNNNARALVLASSGLGRGRPKSVLSKNGAWVKIARDKAAQAKKAMNEAAVAAQQKAARVARHNTWFAQLQASLGDPSQFIVDDATECNQPMVLLNRNRVPDDIVEDINSFLEYIDLKITQNRTVVLKRTATYTALPEISTFTGMPYVNFYGKGRIVLGSCKFDEAIESGKYEFFPAIWTVLPSTPLPGMDEIYPTLRLLSSEFPRTQSGLPMVLFETLSDLFTRVRPRNLKLRRAMGDTETMGTHFFNVATLRFEYSPEKAKQRYDRAQSRSRKRQRTEELCYDANMEELD